MSYSDCTTYSPHKGSLPDKVLAFFVDNGDEELSTIDVAEKFDATPSGAVSQKMAPLVRMGLLESMRRGRLVHYTAGPMLASWAGEAPAPATYTPAITLRPVVERAAAKAQPAPAAPLEIRITLHVHGLGTPAMRLELAGVEP